jgi:hypothetical protein
MSPLPVVRGTMIVATAAWAAGEALMNRSPRSDRRVLDHRHRIRLACNARHGHRQAQPLFRVNDTGTKDFIPAINFVLTAIVEALHFRCSTIPAIPGRRIDGQQTFY